MAAPRTTKIPKCDKDYRPLLDRAKDQGWEFSEPTGDGYAKAWPPDGKSRPIAIPKTPGNPNLLKGVTAQFKRAGLNLE